MFRFLLTVCLCLVADRVAGAAQVQGIRLASTSPIAVRGGVLMSPLVAQQPGTNWPQRLQFSLNDGRIIDGIVAWLEPVAPSNERHWTDDPRSVAVRFIRAGDDSSKPQTGSPIVLARLPEIGDGAMQFDGQIIQPIWLDAVAPPEIVDAELRRLPVRHRDDLPDPDSPLEHWRWVVMADAMELTAPDTSRFDEVSALLAEQQAALWRIGLNRLRGLDQRTAERCTQMLISTGFDRDHRFATWVTDPVALDALLRVLLQVNQPGRRVVAEVQSWIDGQRPVLMWPVSLYGEKVELALVNRLDRAVSVDLTWQQGAAAAERLRLPQGVLSRLVLDRPESAVRRLGLPALDEPTPIVLSVTVSGATVGSLTFPPMEVVAKPPGVFVTALFPALTLADVERVQQTPVESQFATTAHIRRLIGRWEVFIDCRRPADSAATRPAAMVAVNTLDDLRSIDAVTLLIGRDRLTSEAPIVLAVPEKGWWRLLRGRQDGALQIHRRSYDDRWYCRVVLPDAWVESLLEGDTLRLGLVRTHSGDASLHTGPNRCVPWRVQPGQLRVDLSRWDDLPRYEQPAVESP